MNSGAALGALLRDSVDASHWRCRHYRARCSMTRDAWESGALGAILVVLGVGVWFLPWLVARVFAVCTVALGAYLVFVSATMEGEE
jgi:uncharacterized membrane protein YbaN (DUF454 family)